MKVRVEVSSLATTHQSGVAQYTQMLTKAFANRQDITVFGHYFNFLNRQPNPELDPIRVIPEINKLVPLRIYAKMQSYNFAPSFDAVLPRVDLTIFPNFATWPTTKSRLRATTIHDLTYIRYPELVEEANLAHLKRVVPRSIKSADFIITVSETVRKELIDEFNLDPNRCIVTPVPPDDMFRKKLNTNDLNDVRNKYGIGSKKYIFFIGNFEPRKNLAALVKAYRGLPQDIKDTYQLILAGGKGWKSDEAQTAVDEAITAGESVRHIGYIDSADRPALYQAASLFAFPSLYEGFGIPVLEAMLSDCPVIASDIPVLHEAGGTAAMYVDTTNSQAFTVALEQALSNYPYSISDMQQNVARFSWDNNISVVVGKAGEILGDK